MENKFLYRKEENGINRLIMSGRIVSDLIFNTVINTEEQTKILECSFVLAVGNHGNFKPYKILCIDDKSSKFLKKYASVGCRLVFEGKLDSRRRPYRTVEGFGLERYTIDIIMEKTVNIFDTQIEYDKKIESLMIKKNIETKVANKEFPKFDDFDNNY